MQIYEFETIKLLNDIEYEKAIETIVEAAKKDGNPFTDFQIYSLYCNLTGEGINLSLQEIYKKYPHLKEENE